MDTENQNNRKKLLMFVFPCILLVVIIGSIIGIKKVADYNCATTYTYDDLAVYDTVSKKLIRLGDTKETIEKYIGEPNEEDFLSGYYGDNGELFIYYDEDGTAIKFEIYSTVLGKSKRFELPSGINMASTVTDFQEYYPRAKELAIKASFPTPYVSMLYLKRDKDVFKAKNFTNEEFEKEKKDYFEQLSEKYYSKDCAYIAALYDNYTEIAGMTVGYGWLLELE